MHEMLSFEDFFIKKNIDLTALKIAEPVLYKEFELHYHEMGEKSFDHTKKYWFNNLRKQYRLPEQASKAEKVTKPVVTAKEQPASSPATETKQVEFKPRFKATGKPPEDVSARESVSSGQGGKPVGFKPKLRPKVAGDSAEKAKESTAASDTTTEDSSVSKTPSGFKPRFTAGITKQSDPVNNVLKIEPEADVFPKSERGITDNTTEKGSPSKPAGFKPRFKAGITKAAGIEGLPEEKKPSDPVEPSASNTEEADNKPKGFKPRFKAGVTKPKNED